MVFNPVLVSTSVQFYLRVPADRTYFVALVQSNLRRSEGLSVSVETR